MRRQGRVTASIEETRQYLMLVVSQLFTLYNCHQTECGKEAEGGYRDSLETFLCASTTNVIKELYNEIKLYLLQVYGLMLTFKQRKMRLYFYIEPQKEKLCN